MAPEPPAAPLDPWSPRRVAIAHVSDLHIGAHVPAAVDTLLADVAAAAPTLTVVTGDCTMRARVDQFREARALVERLPAPRLVVLGNHDLPLVAPSRITAPYQRYRAHLAADLDPVVDLPGVRAVGLQSMPRWRWKGGRVSRRQADTVADVLGTAPRTSVRLVALHHPPFPRGTRGIVGGRRLVHALTQARVDLVLAGHTHRPATRRIDLPAGSSGHRLVEVVAGTATSARTRGVSRSWSLIRVDRHTTTVEERYETPRGWEISRLVCYPHG